MNLTLSFKSLWDWPMRLHNAGTTHFNPEKGEKTEQREKNRHWLCQMIRSQRQGKSCLPHFIGLHPVDFEWLANSQLSDCHLGHKLMSPASIHQGEALAEQDVRQQLLEMREDEWLEIRELLRQYRRGLDDLELVISDVIAAGCLGAEHLWRDLGLANRSQLSEMIAINFPVLAERNNQNMKWKKFFYKQLCEAEGGYVCRAPSCQQCAAYSDCFGPEE